MNLMDEELLVRYLQNECTSEEIAQVEAWETESDDNKRVLEQLYFILQSSNCLQLMNSASPQLALKDLKKKIGVGIMTMRFHRFITIAQRIAAILFIPILILASYYFIQNVDDTQRYVEVTTNSGMISSFNLPDGSKVWLNSGGKLKYPAEFLSKRREVYLEGQGYFVIKRNEDVPFYVRIDDFYSVEVLGTEFNVTAYEDDHLIETTLVSGKVKLNIQLTDGRFIQKLLKPNEKATYDRKTRRLSIATVNIESDKEWKEGRIIFRQQPMEQVIKILSRYYNVRFKVINPKVLQSEITAKFTNEPLQQVLEYLKLASDIKFKINHSSRIENDTLQTSVIELYK